MTPASPYWEIQVVDENDPKEWLHMNTECHIVTGETSKCTVVSWNAQYVCGSIALGYIVTVRGGYCGWRRIAIRYDTARAYCNTYCNILGILCTVIFRLPKLMLCLFGARISFMMFKNCIIKSWVYDHLMMTFCLQSLGDCSCPVYLFFP